MIWGLHSFPDDTFFRLAFGRLRVYLARRRREWRWVTQYGDAPEAPCFEELPAAQLPELAPHSWRRMITRGVSSSLRFSPRLPDRPLAIIPQQQYQVAQNALVKLWLEVPLWVHLSCENGEPLIELASVRLSNSWLGDSIGGRMGYTLSSEPRYHDEEEAIPQHTARCTLSILNQASTPFIVNKLAVPSELLNLYQGKGEMYTSEVKLLHTRDHEISVNPLHHREPKLTPLVQARVRGVDIFWKRSVGLLRRIGNY